MGKKIRTAIRAASKVQERELIRKAKALRKRPEALVPRCLPETCPRCPFDSLLQRLERVAQFAEDEKRLEALARRGHPLARAYAATLLLAAQEKAPYLAPAKTPFGTVHFARRGKAGQEHLVGVQHYDVPELCLLTVGGWARKRGYYVYSLEEGMVTTCREDRPPRAFVEESLRRLKRQFGPGDGERSCPHVPPEPALVVTWKGAGLDLVLCGKCAVGPENLVAFLRTRMVTPRRAAPFGVALRLDLGCEGTVCGLGADRPLTGEDAEAYLAGKRGEDDLLPKETERALQDAAARGAFLVGRRCFEDDGGAFVQALGLPEDLRPVCLALLEEAEEGLYVPEASLAKFLDALEEGQVDELLARYLEDDTEAEALLEASKGKGREALVQEARALRRDAQVLARIPSWGRLPAVAALADGVARTYRTRGAEEAAVQARRGLDGGPKQKVVALALLEALGIAGGKEWTFREEEKELADFLAETARELLTAEGDAYRDALQRLLVTSGSGESLSPS